MAINQEDVQPKIQNVLQPVKSSQTNYQLNQTYGQYSNNGEHYKFTFNFLSQFKYLEILPKLIYCKHCQNSHITLF